jgi:hypothetical protein
MLMRPQFHSRAFWSSLRDIIIVMRPTHICLCTFNIYTAISNWSGPTRLPTNSTINPNQEVMEHMNNVDSRIIYGANSAAYVREKDDVAHIWPNVQIRYREGNHAKIVTLRRDHEIRGFVGSCNFNDSTSGECMIEAHSTDVKIIQKQFDTWWEVAARNI